VLGPQVGDQLGYFGIGEGVGKGRHLLASIENLIGNFGRGPKLVGAQASEVGSFFAACASGAMAVSAAFVAKKQRACLLVSLGV
jgi:hypothetical protein